MLGFRAFSQLFNLLTQYVFDRTLSLTDEIATGASAWWNAVYLNYESEQLKNAETLASNINAAPNRLKFTPPEVKGRFLYMLTAPTLVDQINLQATALIEGNAALANSPIDPMAQQAAIAQTVTAQIMQLEQAILNVLSYIQSRADYHNVMQHMSLSLNKVNVTGSEHRLYNGLGVYGRSQVKALQKFKEQIDDAANLVIYPLTSNSNQPVQANAAVVAILQGA